MMTEHLFLAFALTIFAGLATGIGSAIAFLSRKTNETFLCAALSFSAGAMIYVSFIEIFPKAGDALAVELGASMGYIVTTAAFFGGIVLIALIDKLVPEFENPHEMHHIEEMEGQPTKPALQRDPPKNLYRMGIFMALAIALHNFPEGLATFIAALKDPNLGIPVAVAVAVHNIPEGVAVSVPIYFATGSRKKAFMFSFLSGLAEPLGALAGYLLLMPFFNDLTFGIMFAMVGGIMVFISFDQILPAAREYGRHHVSVYALTAGMAVMALSLMLFV
jgi:ZIP family zinc transporter